MGRVKAVAAVALTAIGIGWAAEAGAAPGLVDEVQGALYAGRLQDAASVAERRLAESPDDDQARFALGAIRFLRAVEHLGQGFHRYGLRSAYGDPTGLMGLPLLRLPVPPNPKPEVATYEAIRAVLGGFVDDLAAAEQALAKVGDGPVDLPLNIGQIRLDLNGDGVGSEEESLWRIFSIVGGMPLDAAGAQKLLTDFDSSDVLWLRAYCHLLSAIAEFPLAHDWHSAFDATFHGVFSGAGLMAPELAASGAAARARLQAALDAATPPPERGPSESEADFDARMRAWTAEQEEVAWLREQEARRGGGEFAGIADMIAFAHLIHWPVIEPARMRSVLEHLEAMVRLSRETWQRIMAEADQGHEWIPSPAQTGVLPGMQISKDQIVAWRAFLDEFEGLLAGKLLLPHWRFDKGINLRRLFLEPTTFDLVLLVQGSAALPYLEVGQETTEDTWRGIMNVFGGDFFRYAVWLN